MQQNNFYLKKRQLESLAIKLHRLYMDQRVEARLQIDRLMHKIKRLVQELSKVLSHADLKKILGASAILIGISFPTKSNAQSFAAPVQNPFGLTATNYFAVPAFADLDGDGDTDLLVGEYFGILKYFENVGTAQQPEFGTPVTNPFGFTPNSTVAVPAFADLDGDGDMDLLLGEYYGSMKYFENTGSATDPQFASPIVNPFGLTNTYNVAIPTFADLDADGDLDLLVGEGIGGLQYFQNTGSPSSPEFAAPVLNPFGLSSTYYLAFPAFADLDEDGDLDLLVGEYYGVMQYFQNTGSTLSPEFASPVENPFGLVPTYYYAMPAFADLDGDGDVDLLVGEYYGVMQYFENLEATAVGNISRSFDLGLFPNPVDNVLHVESDEPIRKIEIFDVLGEKVFVAEGQVSRVSLHHLNQGAYMVRATSAKGYFTTRKIQKQ